MPVIITAKREGFRRCGMAHSTKPVEHADGTFTKDQLKALQAEPNLVVQVVEPKAEQDAKAKAEQDAKAKAEQDAKAKAEQDAKAKAEQEALAKAKGKGK
ncbi:MAG: hypothetical protein KKC99_05305 [Proteobacteria bacterium]|nr:hypothetical protein [Pseudomonadota bacterium]